ncbi:MAG: hypothetical protein QG608_2627 [Actinomycetota bacterium]|nr:hypothetical protein [Actinomycetota bacterium]
MGFREMQIMVSFFVPRKNLVRRKNQECAIRLDPRSPYILDTRELGRRPGTMRKVQRTVPAPDDLGTDVIGVPPGTDVELDLRLESVMEGVLVSGTVQGRAVGECVRCLGEVEWDLRTRFQELYEYTERTRDDDDENEDEIRRIQDDLIDLEPALRDTAVLALPFQPLCQDDCPGLCSECGARLADDPDHGHEDLDPRWAALQILTSDPDVGTDGGNGQNGLNHVDDLKDDEKES